MNPAPAPSVPNAPSPGGQLVSTDGRALPLTKTELAADARGGIARVVLSQTFHNPHDVPLAVTYSVPLPADAAVSAFAFTVGDRRIVGEIDRRAAARERFEAAVLEGKTAALLEQDRSSLFSQEIGNIPPGATVVAELGVDQRLRWLGEGSWEWRFPTVVAPRYLGAPGRVTDGGRITQAVADGPLPVRATLALTVHDELAGAPASPSHPLTNDAGRVSFAAGGVALDRDVVVHWPVARAAPGLTLAQARPAEGPLADAAYGLVTLVPPAPSARPTAVARDLIVLLDTSGSMGGEPLAQARRVVSALIETLGERDSLELIEFSSEPRRWKAEAVRATAGARKEALAWLAQLRASGGTEMREGILAALRPLRAESQRQIVLITDGLIGFEAEVIGAIARDLPPGSRVHTVGVGSAVNRALTGPAARAGRGLEVVIGLGEDPERAAQRLCARTDAPLVVDLSLGGSALLEHAPRFLPDLFAGAPVLLGLKLRPEGGTLTVRGRLAAGEYLETIDVAACAAGAGGDAVVKLFGRELVEDLEAEIAAGGDREASTGAIERIGLAYQVATRVTSWVAIASEVSVDPTQPSRRERMPHELPHGMSVEGLGLRSAAVMRPSGMPPMMAAFMPPAPMRSMARVFKKGAAEKPEAPSIVSRTMSAVRDFLGGSGAGEGAGDAGWSESVVPSEPLFKPAHDDEEEMVKGGAAPGEVRRLRGRITQDKDGKLALEIDVDGDLAWEVVVGDEVEIAWADGTRGTAAVALATRVGVVRAGETARLVLEVPAVTGGAGGAREIVVSSGPVRLVITL